jgi:hypothetical protein
MKLRNCQIVLYSVVTKNVSMEQKLCFDRMINGEQIDVSEVSGNHIKSRDLI